MYDARDVIVTEIQMWLARELLAVQKYEYDEQVSRYDRPTARFAIVDQLGPVCQGRNSEKEVRRLDLASMRGHAQGYDRFKACKHAGPAS